MQMPFLTQPILLEQVWDQQMEGQENAAMWLEKMTAPCSST